MERKEKLNSIPEGNERSYKTPLELVGQGKFLYIAAPMVRYSKYINSSSPLTTV